MVTIRAIGSIKEDIECPGLNSFDMARNGFLCFFARQESLPNRFEKDSFRQ
jgi:hypothetical protein